MLQRALMVFLLFIPALAATAEEDASWCRGYVVKALGEFPQQGLDRNDLFLAWNETVRATIIEGELDQDRYQAGRASFSEHLAAGNVGAMIETSDEQCDLGRNSSWVWW